VQFLNSRVKVKVGSCQHEVCYVRIPQLNTGGRRSTNWWPCSSSVKKKEASISQHSDGEDCRSVRHSLFSATARWERRHLTLALRDGRRNECRQFFRVIYFFSPPEFSDVPLMLSCWLALGCLATQEREFDFIPSHPRQIEKVEVSW
jgi:hypothetical protein